jgi:glycosyltransferase involved in cell wall biosynthesis
MEKLSAVIITYNEERNIERCIRSLEGIADEIVVLDSFSADRTKEICEKHGVNFFTHKFDGYTISCNNPVILFHNIQSSPKREISNLDRA